MPPKIALLLCIFFILYVFIIDFKRNPNISHALWIPLVWVMIIGSKNVSYWLNIGSSQSFSVDLYQSGSPVDRIVFSLLEVAGLFILSRRKINWSQLLRSNSWIFIFYLYCAISILWSDFPGVAFKRLIKAMGNIIMILIVLTEQDPVEAIKSLFRRCAYILIPLSHCFLKYFPSIGRRYHSWTGELMVVGVTTNKNTLGQLCLVCGLVFFWILLTMWYKKKESSDKINVSLHIVFFFLILWLLITSNCASALMSFIIGVIIIIGLKFSFVKRNIRFIGVYVFFTLVIFLILQVSFNILQIIVVDFLGRNMTLTERTDIWKILINMDTNPIIGTGYDNFWLGNRMQIAWSMYTEGLQEAHNGYLETYLELGWIGIFLLICVILFVFRKISEGLIFNFEYGIFRMAFLVIFLAYNISETANKGLHLIWFVFLLTAIDGPDLSDNQIQEIDQKGE